MDETKFLNQTVVINRAMPELRANSSTGGPDILSAVSCAKAAGVSSDYSSWGEVLNLPPSANRAASLCFASPRHHHPCQTNRAVNCDPSLLTTPQPE